MFDFSECGHMAAFAGFRPQATFFICIQNRIFGAKGGGGLFLANFHKGGGKVSYIQKSGFFHSSGYYFHL